MQGKLFPLQVGMRKGKLCGGNAPVYIYDTSGPYSDKNIEIDLDKGLPKLRAEWAKDRIGNCITQMHYAKQGIITPEM